MNINEVEVKKWIDLIMPKGTKFMGSGRLGLRIMKRQTVCEKSKFNISKCKLCFISPGSGLPNLVKLYPPPLELAWYT